MWVGLRYVFRTCNTACATVRRPPNIGSPLSLSGSPALRLSLLAGTFLAANLALAGQQQCQLIRSGCVRYYLDDGHWLCSAAGGLVARTTERTDGGATFDDKYSIKKECFDEENVATMNWGLNKHIKSNKRSTNESGTLEYYSQTKKPFIKPEYSSSSDSSMNNTAENTAKGLMHNDQCPIITEFYSHFEFECGQESNGWIEKSDASSNTETKNNDDKSTIMSLQTWLQLPAAEYAQYCRQFGNFNQLDNNVSDDDDHSDADNQLLVHQTWDSQTANDEESSSDPSQGPLRMRQVDRGPRASELQSRVAERRVDPCVGYPKRDKRLSDLAKVKPRGVEKRQTKSLELNKTAGKLMVRKNSDAKERRECVDKEAFHDGRRMTRSLIKSIENISPTNNVQNHIGKFVWGYCMGWWPAIIVAAEDGGLESKPDKVCVYWIGEDLISLLNEKTQVESFSINLEMRLLRYLKDDDGKKDRRKTCFVTLKLFSKYLGIPLLKPYEKWARKHLMGKTHLNDLRFHPLPKNIQQRLAQLKEQNIKATEKIVEEKARAARSSNESAPSDDREFRDSFDKTQWKNGSQSRFPKDFVRKSTNKLILNSVEEQQILPLIDQKPGIIVWGKIAGHNWWPAMIIHSHDCGKKEPNFGCQWIIWYGDYQLSQVHYLNVMKFNEGIQKMRGYITQCKRETYVEAVLNACKDHCARFNYDTSSWTMADVLAWISSLDSNSKKSAIARPNDGRLESRYSPHIAEKLKEIKSNQEVAAERKNRIKNCDALKAVFSGIPNTLEVLCIICLTIFYDGLEDHPFFKCAVCRSCVEEFKAAIFAYGDDGKCFYCTLCAGSGTVVMCDSCDCPRVYCTACLKYLICPAEYVEILIKDHWLCLLCDNHDLNKTGVLEPRPDWKTRIGKLFNTNQVTSWNDAWNNDRKPKKMRVISLFDGISTGLLALEKLGIEVEDYYASEINSDAELVSASHFGDRICRLGDVRNITKDIIKGIKPIDLLIGGSPCNDLSLVNPNRLGLHDPKGTGILFFEYCRLKELIIEANEGHHLFWLFENVASMPSSYRLTINESLGCEPSLIDAADFSPQHRPRLFWSNLPIGVNFPPPDPSQDLQSVLTPNCNRHALVKKIQTVTTRVNSLKQGVSLLKPVLMNSEPDSLWITELEEIFGFPKHFTDVRNLSATKRQKLIGQSWSVQTITAILQPLRYFFLTKSLQARN